MQEKKMITVWEWVGITLLIYGLIILFSFFFLPPSTKILSELKPSLWWGGIMCIAGGIFLFGGRRSRRQKSMN